MFSLHQLRTFLEVARSGSVREAGKRLIVSQPAVSAALASLQREVGARLVERHGRGLRITASGREMERYGRKILALIDEAERGVRDVAAPGTGTLRLAAVTTAAEHLVPRLLSEFRLHHPLIDVELEVGNRGHVWSRLAHWEVDLVVGGRPPLHPAFRTLAISPNDLVVVAAPGGSWDAQKLSSATWLLREVGSGTRSATEELFALLGITPATLTIGSNVAIRECILAGLGVSILTREAVEREVAGGLLSIVETAATPLARDWHLVANSDAETFAPVNRFVEHAIAMSTFHAPSSAP